LPKADIEQLALEALSRALIDPAPRVLFGSKAKLGIFDGAGQALKQAAQLCLDRGWLEGSGQFEGKGKTRKELFRITTAAAQEAISKSEPVGLFKDALGYLEKIVGLKDKVEATLGALQKQREITQTLLERWQPPDWKRLLENVARASTAPPISAAADASHGLLTYLEDYQKKNPYGHCPLPELYHRSAEARGLTIGQFHDCLRRLVQEKKVRLHPFTGAAYQLQEEQFALLAGQEIKYYAERLAGA
jgi:hypothetical protein